MNTTPVINATGISYDFNTVLYKLDCDKKVHCTVESMGYLNFKTKIQYQNFHENSNNKH